MVHRAGAIRAPPTLKAMGNIGMRLATVIMLRQRDLDDWREKEGIEYLVLELHVNQSWSQV